MLLWSALRHLGICSIWNGWDERYIGMSARTHGFTLHSPVCASSSRGLMGAWPALNAARAGGSVYYRIGRPVLPAIKLLPNIQWSHVNRLS